MADERGVGNVFNVPRGPGMPAALYVDDLWAAIVAATTGWEPDLILVSAGFDAMTGDPLGGFTLEPEHYADLTRRLRERLPRAPIVGLLEGGYIPARIAAGLSGAPRAPSPRPLRPPPLTPRGRALTDTLRMETEVLKLRTKHPFIIARGGRSDYETVWVRLSDGDGNEGWGEAAPSSYYGENTESILAALQRYAKLLPADPFDLENAERRWYESMRRNPSARAALSAALHDLVGKRLGVPV